MLDKLEKISYALIIIGLVLWFFTSGIKFGEWILYQRIIENTTTKQLEIWCTDEYTLYKEEFCTEYYKRIQEKQ